MSMARRRSASPHPNPNPNPNPSPDPTPSPSPNPDLVEREEHVLVQHPFGLLLDRLGEGVVHLVRGDVGEMWGRYRGDVGEI